MASKAVQSLNEIASAIECSVCGDKATLSVHVDGLTNYEGSNITPSNLNIILMKPDFIVDSYSIDVNTGLIKINSMDRSRSNKNIKKISGKELLRAISKFRLRAGYCTRNWNGENDVYYDHVIYDYDCKVDIDNSKLLDIEYVGFTISDINNDGIYRRIQTTETSTEIRVGHCGQPPPVTSLKIKALSLSKCVEILRNDKYLNFL